MTLTMKSITRETFLTVAIFMLTAATAYAFDAVDSGGFGYVVYDFIVNKILLGPIGKAIAVVIVALCIFFLIRNQIFSVIACAVAAGMIVSIEEIVDSMGMTTAEVLLRMVGV